MMSIPLVCECGRSIKAKAELAGRKVRCPVCGATLLVPRTPAGDDEEDEALGYLMAEEPVSERRERQPRKEAVDTEDDEPEREQPRPRPRSQQREWSAKGQTEFSKPRSIRKRGKSDGGWLPISVNGQIITGSLMIAGAVLWFVAGLAAGRIFFYPPIMFVLGILAVGRGIKGEA